MIFSLKLKARLVFGATFVVELKFSNECRYSRTRAGKAFATDGIKFESVTAFGSNQMWGNSLSNSLSARFVEILLCF